MTDKFQYRDQFYALCPPWLTTDDAEKFMYTMQACTDLLVEKANEAIQIRLPGLGDRSQIPYLANDRVLVQGPAEPDAGFIVRLREAFATWGLAGSPRAVMLQLQAYLQNLQPGVPAAYPLATIVGGPMVGGTSYARWHQLYQGDALGALPTVTIKSPSNIDWDGLDRPWRSWLILPMVAVATGLSGASAATTTANGGSFTSPGHNVGGVWVPQTSGTPINAPFITITGLSGMTTGSVGQWLTLSGSSHAGNNGFFPIVEYVSATSVVIANPSGVASDAGPLVWSVSAYPFIGPALPYGSPGIVYGQGELVTPPVDTGHNFRGVWQPSLPTSATSGTTFSYGLDVPATQIASIRALVKTWKSAGTYYPNIIIAFDAGAGNYADAYSPNSTGGTGNPDGTFGSVGKLANGVWVPSRLITSQFDAYCQGTGVNDACSVENVT